MSRRIGRRRTTLPRSGHEFLNLHVLERPPRFLLHKIPVAVRISPWLLLMVMSYFGLIYLLIYSPLAVKNPVIDYSMSLRPAFGFEPVRSTVVLHMCIVLNGASQSCPPDSSDYVSAVLLSWASPVARPKSSVTFVLFELTLVDLVYECLQDTLRRMTGATTTRTIETFLTDHH
jgi:hypothetical protein